MSKELHHGHISLVCQGKIRKGEFTTNQLDVDTLIIDLENELVVLFVDFANLVELKVGGILDELLTSTARNRCNLRGCTSNGLPLHSYDEETVG